MGTSKPDLTSLASKIYHSDKRVPWKDRADSSSPQLILYYTDGHYFLLQLFGLLVKEVSLQSTKLSSNLAINRLIPFGISIWITVMVCVNAYNPRRRAIFSSSSFHLAPRSYDARIAPQGIQVSLTYLFRPIEWGFVRPCRVSHYFGINIHIYIFILELRKRILS